LPFKTLTYASQAAAGPGTIWLERGSFDATTEPRLAFVTDEPIASVCGDISGIVIPEGVDVRGLSSESVTISVQGRHGLCARGSSFSKIVFERTSLEGSLLEFDGGSGELRAVSFQNFDGPSGNVTHGPLPSLILSAQSSIEWLAEPAEQSLGEGALASLKDQARLRVVGGQSRLFPLHQVSAQALFRVETAAVLQLSAVGLHGAKDRQHVAVAASGLDPLAMPSVSFTDHTLVEGFSNGCRIARSVRVSLADSEFAGQSFAAVSGIPIFRDDRTSVRIERSTLRENSYGAFVLGNNTTVRVADSVIEGNVGGLFLNVGSVSIESSRIVDNSGSGVHARAGSFSMRGTSLERNGSGLTLEGDVLQADLGTASDPGRNFFGSARQNAEDSVTNLALNCSNDCFVNAAGNTWVPLVQGADKDGHYSAPAREPLDVDSGSGANYAVSSGTLRLAE